MSTSLQNKLLQYAPEPPEKVWDAITNALDGNAAPGFAEKLYVFEQVPSPHVWNRLSNQLDFLRPVRAVPFFQRYKKLATYSAAAAILIFIAIGIALFPSKTKPAIVANTPANIQSKKIIPDPNAPSEPYATESSSSLAAANQHRNTGQKNIPGEKKNLLSRLRPSTYLGSVMIAKTFIPRKAETRQTVNSDAPIEKYMVYSDGDGNAMRLPKKLFDFISCVKEDIRCKQEMQQLQEQFASAVLTTDFTGVLEILKTLKENQ